MPEHATDPRDPTRRAVVKGAAWTAPVIVAAAAAPAYAASTTSLVPTFDGNSFRAADNVALFNRIPSAGPAMALAVNVLVANAGVTSLSCVLTTASAAQTMSFYNIGSTISRPAQGGTTWAPNNGGLAANGWTATPALPANAAVGSPTTGTAVSTFSFARGAVTAGTTVPLRMTLFNVDNADFPLRFQFSAPGTPTPPALVVAVGDVATA